jgi:hypothetical protein
MIEAARVVRCFLYQMLTAALALAVLPPAAAQRAVAPAFPTEWQGKWCTHKDTPSKAIYARSSHECILYQSSH